MFADSPCRPTIAVRDKAQAIAFYRDVLGFTLVDANQPGATFACGGGTFLEIYPSEMAGTAKNTVAGFQVPDLEMTIRELRSRGVTFEEYEAPKTVDGIAQLGPNRGAWFKDPDGNTFALVELGSPQVHPSERQIEGPPT
jgi:catechol 2,3-dioxygenase-like lactoylglutathione lyase family enzyme